MFILLLYSKFKDSFKFLYKIEINIPNENSKPAKPKIKKDRLSRDISQYRDPNKIDKTYKTNHINSEINSIKIKFLGFTKIIISAYKYIIDQNDIQVNI